MLIPLLLAFTMQAEPIVGRASVIDGDTLEIRGQRIRLWGIDAPEGRQTCTREGETYRCGTEAARHLDDALADKTVSCAPKGRPDRYGRIIAVCSITIRSCGSMDCISFPSDLAHEMVVRGWAVDYPAFSQGAYVGAQQAARSAGNGVWAGAFQMPWEWRRARR